MTWMDEIAVVGHGSTWGWRMLYILILWPPEEYGAHRRFFVLPSQPGPVPPVHPTLQDFAYIRRGDMQYRWFSIEQVVEGRRRE